MLLETQALTELCAALADKFFYACFYSQRVWLDKRSHPLI